MNTSPITQAVAGTGCWNTGAVWPAPASGRARWTGRPRPDRRRAGPPLPHPSASGASRNSPEGGFFVVVDVPFDVTDEALERSVRDHRVLWTPLHHFHDAAASGTGTGIEPLRCLRLSCSALGPEDIGEALDRSAAFVRSA
ncbi:hypothetical protein ACFUN7_27920 [Streptomyces sp. NPDC057236]|uniref:hypothetical protein n=1 Tax=Streptomyces sp. NPDC057236 TaxID=3346059 RepID=UPI003638AB67